MKLPDDQRGTPRIAGRLLRRVRDFASVRNQHTVGEREANEALNLLEVDPLGLDNQDIRYLKTIIDYYKGDLLELKLYLLPFQNNCDTLEEVIEPYLIQQGFIQRTPRGGF